LLQYHIIPYDAGMNKVEKSGYLIKGVAAMGLYSNDFSEVFSKLLDEMGVTCYQLHEYTKLDQAYLSRLRSGEKSNPTPETIMKISLGLVHYSSKVKISDIEKLFKSVGRSLHLYSY